MKQAALFDSGLMIVIGDKTSQIGEADDLVNLPTKVLKDLFTDLVEESPSGVMTLKAWLSPKGVLEVSRDAFGYSVELLGENGFCGSIHRSEADDLRTLIFGRYSSTSGFWWPAEILEEVAEPA